jgi:hypothetical protein
MMHMREKGLLAHISIPLYQKNVRRPLWRVYGFQGSERAACELFEVEASDIVKVWELPLVDEGAIKFAGCTNFFNTLVVSSALPAATSVWQGTRRWAICPAAHGAIA